MSTMVYDYTWTNNFNITGRPFNLYEGDDAIKADIIEGLKSNFTDKLTEKIIEVGHSLKIFSIDVTISHYGCPRIPIINRVADKFYMQGQIVVKFETDAPFTQEFSPQGWEELLLALAVAIGTFIVAHGTILCIILLATIVFVGLICYNQAGGVAGTLFGKGAGVLGDIGTIIILGGVVIAAIIILPELLRSRKGRRR